MHAHVWIIRHGKAQERAPSGRDRDRELAERGVAQAAHLGRHLASHEHRPAAIIASPAERTRRTAELIAVELSLAVATDDRLFVDHPLDPILSLLDEAERDPLAIVGHNPTLSLLIGRCMGGPVAPPVQLKTGQGVLLAVDTASPIGRGEVLEVTRLDG